MEEEIIRIHVGPEVHEFPVKRFEQLTVADYIRIVDAPEGEQQYDMVSRVFGIPRRITLAMKTLERAQLLQWYLDWLKSGNDIQKQIAEVGEGLKALAAKEKRQWTHKDMREALAQAGLLRTSIVVDGRTFSVPHRIDNTAGWGQWISLRSAQEKHEKSKAIEARLYPTILAILCMEAGDDWPHQAKEEEDDVYAKRFQEWYAPRVPFFHGARYVDAQAVCAFFFSSSLEFEEIMHPSLRRFPRSKRPSSTAEAKP